ncbi:MAG TPA: threonine synthase [Longimicrobiales bacterium]|nr:threonine synthase [Longimicrobiales bacterium]
MSARIGLLERYADWLPLTPDTPRLTLFEGSTPLVDTVKLAKWVGVKQLFLKYDGLNPTGSFKDRGMVMAVAKAAEEGARSVICASTGNTAASAAAYAARAGMRCAVLLPSGKVALGKVAQAVAYGARVVVVDTNFDGALDRARELATDGAALVNSVNPYRLDGQTSAAFEICDELGGPPNVLALPLGNGGNITAYWLGFRRYHERAVITALPRVFGIQAAGAAPFVAGHPIDQPETIATAIRIGKPATWQPAIDAAQHSHGAIRAVTDEEIMEAYRAIASSEGVFCEPASAASVAGLRAAVREGAVSSDELCVCVLTGNGLKDPDSALRGVQVMEARNDLTELRRVLASD